MTRWTAIAALLLLSPIAARAQSGSDGAEEQSWGASAAQGRDGATRSVVVEHGKAGTADASPVDPGAAEVELAYAPSWIRPSGPDAAGAADAHQYLGTATLTYGVAPEIDVALGLAFGSVFDASPRMSDPTAPQDGAGLGDLSVAARWRFLRLAGAGTELAVIGGAVLPTGTHQSATGLGLSQEYWSVHGALVATQDLGRATANAELGLTAPVAGDAAGLRSALRASGAVGVQVLSWLQPELELSYAASFGTPSRVLATTAGLVAPFGTGQRLVAAVQQDVWTSQATPRTAALVAFKTAL